MKQKYLFSILSLVLAVTLMSGCAALVEKWKALDPDEKARIILNEGQDQLANLFVVGKTYVDANPEAKEAWQTKIIPVFDTANKTLAHAMALAQVEEITPAEAEAVIQPFLTDIFALLVELGAISR